ncbi:MAG: DUF3786 domain-containing protein [Lachnospiraceae bacterium]|nr:DUF3786 domain-containing protein [Lachnospiraceae bacterium]
MQESNYDKFKRDALVRFLTYDQDALIRRLGLEADEEYIYITFCQKQYRLHRGQPLMEIKHPCSWLEADSNAVLTICDLLCHTPDPIRLSGNYTSLESLNRVKGGTTSTQLGDGFFGKGVKLFDGACEDLAAACRSLGGVPMGKGDVAFRIPLFGNIALQLSFYESDDEFPAQLTVFLDSDICNYLFFETLWYMVGMVLETITEKMLEKDI